MRELKFRQWDPAVNVWTYWGYLKPGEFTTPSWFNNQLLTEPSLQYTGLKDPNGVEIYEGDIVTTHPNRSPLPIVWNDEMARFNIGSFRIEHGEVENIEIIGNIYENKDLLK